MPKLGCITPSQFHRIQFKEVKDFTGTNKADYIEYCERTEQGRKLLQKAEAVNGKLTIPIIKTVVDQLPGRIVPMAGAVTYAEEIILDILGVERDDVTAASLEHGIENEPYAIERYERDTMSEVKRVQKAIKHPEFDYIWGTPDGLIGEHGGIEVKCPWNPLWHLHNFKGQGIKDYYEQIQGYMWITGRSWWDFVSYDPRFPANKQIIIIRVERDHEFIAGLETRCIMFWKFVNEKLQEYI